MAQDSSHGITWVLIWEVLITCVGSSFLIGYNLAILNLPKDYVMEFLNNTMLSGKNTDVTPTFLYAQVIVTFVVAAMIGAGSCGFIADGLGRRNGLLFNHIFAILGGALCFPCVYANSAALLFVGRFFIGINCGITIGIASLHLTEIAPRELRGAIGACSQLAITMGILIAYLITLDVALNSATLWPIACGFGAIPATISLFTLPFLPESPRFLFLKKNDEAGARKAFLRLNSKDDVETFLGELREEVEVAKNQPEFRFFQLFTQKDLRLAVALACLIQVAQQLSGINAVVSYSSIMFSLAGIPSEYIQYCVIANGALNVLMTIISLPLLERAGRRTLLLWPTCVLALSLLLLTITVNLATSLADPKAKQIMGAISVVLVLVYMCGFAVGLGPIPGLIVSEIFRQGPRAAAYSLSQSLQWFCNLLVLFSYPSMSEKIGGYSFLPFLVVVAVCWVVFYFYMPETRNRTFDEVARNLTFGNTVVGKRTAPLEDRTMTVFTKDQHNANNESTTKPLLHKNPNISDSITSA